MRDTTTNRCSRSSITTSWRFLFYFFCFYLFPFSYGFSLVLLISVPVPPNLRGPCPLTPSFQIHHGPRYLQCTHVGSKVCVHPLRPHLLHLPLLFPVALYLMDKMNEPLRDNYRSCIAYFSAHLFSSQKMKYDVSQRRIRHVPSASPDNF